MTYKIKSGNCRWRGRQQRHFVEKHAQIAIVGVLANNLKHAQIAIVGVLANNLLREDIDGHNLS